MVLLLVFPFRKIKPFIVIFLLLAILVGIYGNLFQIENLKHVDFRLRVDFIFELGTFFMMGALLGDGCFRKGKYQLTISKPDSFLIERIKSLLPLGDKITCYGTKGYEKITASLKTQLKAQIVKNNDEEALKLFMSSPQ